MPNGFAIAAALLMLGAQGGQGINDVRRLYDAGKFREAIGAAEQSHADGDSGAQRLQYLTAQSQEKLKNTDGAKDNYQRLASSGDQAWGLIGRAGAARLDKRLDEAVDLINKATEANDSLPDAHFERGLILMTRRDYEGAASAFNRTIALDGMNAAAHYYAGLAEYRAKRVDRMAGHFETFLRLAPDAPERPEVESIMKTIRGR
jgi:tetratricopeptide (TPR) repeat protein